MSAEIDPTARIFKKDSRAERISHWAVAISVIFFLATLILCAIAIVKAPSWGLLIAVLALFWAVGAPAWFWYEYFFLYRKDGEKGSFELYKHGHQVSIAIWAGLTVSLGALANSDLFKEKDIPLKAAGAAVIPVQGATPPNAQQSATQDMR